MKKNIVNALALCFSCICFAGFAYTGEVYQKQPDLSNSMQASKSAPTTVTVTSNANKGAGTLRQAIEDIKEGGTITFKLPAKRETITVSSPLTITKNLTIDGSNKLGSKQRVTVKVASPGVSKSRVFSINCMSSSPITINYMNIQGGDISSLGPSNNGYGGSIGVYNGYLRLSSVVVSNSKAYSGGGIAVNVGARASMTNCAIAFNTALNDDGGGVTNAGTMSLTGCTVSNNSAVLAGGGIVNSGTLTLTNCTIASNTLTSTKEHTDGAGILQTNGYLFLSNCTIAYNIARGTVRGVGLTIEKNSTLDIKNTIIAKNLTGKVYQDFAFIKDSPLPVVTDNNYNVIGVSNSWTTGYPSTKSSYLWKNKTDWAMFGVSGDDYRKVGSSKSQKLYLGNLADNGGITMTAAPSEKSFALYPVPSTNNYNNSPDRDQRGVKRGGGYSAIGAYAEPY